ncbi:hypothetical protein, partial [Microvirga tunisiensis]|uniref:hypothetical protein n=1 Tax=Microvirga tunisiensis TaxID=2108360 RepID=UPI001AEE117B
QKLIGLSGTRLNKLSDGGHVVLMRSGKGDHRRNTNVVMMVLGPVSLASRKRVFEKPRLSRRPFRRM